MGLDSGIPPALVIFGAAFVGSIATMLPPLAPPPFAFFRGFMSPSFTFGLLALLVFELFFIRRFRDIAGGESS